MKPELRLNQQILNASLPDMPPGAESCLRHQIHRLSAQQEDKPVKKKLSLGLVLALVITVLTLSALAAVLIGGKDFVEQVLAPKAVENQSEIWTRAELDELKRIAQENGLPITEQLEKAFDRPEGYFKQEVIHAVLRDALGFHYSTWSVEDQAWHENILVKTGLKDFTWATVPQPGDVSLKDAQEIAEKYIADAWAPEPDLMNPEIYRHHQQFQNFKENQHQQGRRWYLEFEALDLSHDGYSFTIESTGKVAEANRRPGMGKEDPTAYQVFDRYENVSGNMAHWSAETWLSFQRDLKRAVNAHGDGGMISSSLYLSQEYALPTPDMITKEAAIQLAKEVSGAPGQDHIDRANAVLLADEGTPVWKVSLPHAIEGPIKRVLPFLVEINALNGEVRNVFVPTPEDFRGYHPFILTRLIPDLKPTSTPGPTRRPDGKPGFWYSDRAPEYYWKVLDDYGYTKGDQGGLIESWYKNHGTDQSFWPLEAQALIALWHSLPNLEGAFPGLPAPGDISQDKALATAREALLADKTTGLNLDEAALDALAVQFTFSFHSLHPGSRVWQVAFVEYPEGQKNVLASVTINARTGEVMEVAGGEAGNG